MKGIAKGKNGVVSSAHPLATQAGLAVLKKDGNAVDAAIAVAVTLGVVAPAWSGLGGGGFGLIHLSRSDETFALDYREVAPKNAHSEMFELDKTGDVKNRANAIGPLAVAVPGAVYGMATMLERYGTLTINEVCRPARNLAMSGTPVSPTMGLITRENRDDCTDKLRRFGPASSVFLRNGKPLPVGRKLLIPNLAATLDTIGRYGAEAFYKGRLGKQIVQHLEKNGGILTREDLAEYSSKIRAPVIGTYRNIEVRGMPPPSSGGLSIIEILNTIEGFDFSKMKHNSPQAIHIIAEAMKLAYSERDAHVADPDFVDVPTSRLTSKEHADQLRRKIDDKRSGLNEARAYQPYDGSSTTHLSVMDKEGNVVALTESVECYFGSGILVPEVGLLMNDEMHDFDPRPGKLNSVEPKKRPLSSMAPTILFKDGRPWLALGSAGGPRIISSVAQAIVNMVDFGMTLQQAVAAPRFHCQRDKISLERGIVASTLNGLKKLGHGIEIKHACDLLFGGVQATVFDFSQRTYLGTADPRRDGIAIAF